MAEGNRTESNCEPLEGRRMLFAPAAFARWPAPPAPSVPVARASLAGRDLTIVGTCRDDELTLGADARGRVTLNGEALLVGRRRTVKAADVGSILVAAGGGDDRVSLRDVTCVAFPRLARAVIRAGAGDDTVLGSAGRDSIDGGGGIDVLRGLDGDDQIAGGGGEVNILSGNGGDDRLLGGDGLDIMYGGAGDDLLRGGEGPDMLCAAGTVDEDPDAGPTPLDEGADTLDGGAGDDLYYLIGAGSGRFTFREAPGVGRDLLNAVAWDYPLDLDLASTAPQPHGAPGHWLRFTSGDGFEVAYGGRFDDVIRGNARPNDFDGLEGDDLLIGRGGDDTMGGAEGSDTMRGDDGDDLFRLYHGDDVAAGGAGSDTYKWAGLSAYGRDRVEEGPDADADTLDFSEAFGAVTIDLGSTEEQGVLGPGGAWLRLTLSDAAGIENVLAVNGGDQFPAPDAIRGNSRPNLIATFAGDDAIDVAGGGIDAVFAGAGADPVVAGPEDEVFADADPPS